MALTVDYLNIVQEELLEACAKWYDIGLALKVPVATLDSIRRDDQFGNHSDKLREALKVWLQTAVEPSWRDVVGALKSRAVGERKLARDIESKHCTAAESGQASGSSIPPMKRRKLRGAQLQTLQQESPELRTEDEQQRQDSREPVQQKTIQDMRWQKESKAPDKLHRGSAAADSNVAYFNGHVSTIIHSYDSDTGEWRRLPATPHPCFALVVLHHVLVVVGGRIPGPRGTDSLLSHMGKGKRKRWLRDLPAMPTKRSEAAAVCTGHSLIVAGGKDGHDSLSVVEVLDTDTRQWSVASSLTHPCTLATMSICGERLYMLGANDHFTRSVLSCSVKELLQSCQPQPLAEKPQAAPDNQSTIWRHVADAPHSMSSCVTFCGQLVAVGGWDDKAVGDTGAISGYHEATDSWEALGDMPTARRMALVAVVNGKMMVVGGGWTVTDAVEILC